MTERTDLSDLYSQVDSHLSRFSMNTRNLDMLERKFRDITEDFDAEQERLEDEQRRQQQHGRDSGMQPPPPPPPSLPRPRSRPPPPPPPTPPSPPERRRPQPRSWPDHTYASLDGPESRANNVRGNPSARSYDQRTEELLQQLKEAHTRAVREYEEHTHKALRADLNIKWLIHAKLKLLAGREQSHEEQDNI